MTRILLLAGIAMAAASLLNEGFQRLKKELGAGESNGAADGTAVASRRKALVACSACGVHVLSTRAVRDEAGSAFCTEGCRRSAAKPV